MKFGILPFVVMLSLLSACTSHGPARHPLEVEGVPAPAEQLNNWNKLVPNGFKLVQVIEFKGGLSVLRLCRVEGQICRAPWRLVSLKTSADGKVDTETFDASDIPGTRKVSKDLDVAVADLPAVVKLVKSEPSQSNESRIRSFYDALVTANRDALLKLIDSNLTIDIQSKGERSSGLISNFFRLQGLKSKLGYPKYEMEEIVQSGSFIFVKGHLDATQPCKSDKTCPPRHQNTADLLTVNESGLVTKAEIFHLDL